MLISEMMTKDVATVAENATLNEAFQILHDKRHKVLPVVRGGKLVGLLSEKLLAEVKPSKATTLSVYEINYLMTRTKVSDVMLKPAEVFSTEPSALVEDAALEMYNHDIGSLPVIEADKTLVGIITQTDIFKAFMQLMGVEQKGARLSLDVPDGVGTVAKIAKILADANVNINNIGNYEKIGGRHEVVLRVDTNSPEDIIVSLSDIGVLTTDVRIFR